MQDDKLLKQAVFDIMDGKNKRGRLNKVDGRPSGLVHCGINFISLRIPFFRISRILHTALLCPHSPIPDLLSTYLMVSFILG